MTRIEEDRTTIRLAELIAALSIATDLGMGQPVEYALQSCILAVRLGQKLKLSDNELRDVYYQALLQYINCNIETHIMTALIGDEISIRQQLATVDSADIPTTIRIVSRHI